MIQIELYVKGLEEAQKLFEQGMGLTLVEQRPGWRVLRAANNYDIMLFDETHAHIDTATHADYSHANTYGAGMQLVLLVPNAAEKHEHLTRLNYPCTALRRPPWGGVDFTLQLKEGYSIRIKQPAA